MVVDPSMHRRPPRTSLRGCLIVAALEVACRLAEPEVVEAPEPSERATAPAPKVEAAPSPVATIDDDALVEIQRRAHEALEGEVLTWMRTAFETQADAVESLSRLLPSSPHAGRRRREAARSLGFDAAAASAYAEAHPEVVAHIEAELAVAGVVPRLMQTPEARAQHERLVLLPRGGLDERLAAMTPALQAELVEWVPSMAPPAGRLPGWHRTEGVADLRSRIEQAIAEDRPIAIYVRAAWASPALEMEASGLDDPPVREAMAERLRVIVDLTEDGDDFEAALEPIGLAVVPTLVLCTDPRRLAAALTGSRRGRRSVRVLSGTLARDELLAALER